MSRKAQWNRMFIRAGATLIASLLVLGGCQSQPQLSPALIADNNHAVGLMGQYRNEDARLVFDRLVEKNPDQPVLRTNLAIAMLNRQTEGDEEAALQIARRVLQQSPHHLPARYVAGLAQLYLGRVDDALPDLLQVAEADPTDPHAAYFAAQALAQSGREAEALPYYQRALQLDPYLRSAYYAAALLQRKAGNSEAAKALLADYQRLAGNPRAHLAEFRYTRMGHKAEAKVLGPAAESAAIAERREGPLFNAPDTLSEIVEPFDLPGLLTADLDRDGLQDLLLLNGGAGGSRVWRGDGAGYREWPGHPLAGLSELQAAAFGDLDNDGQLDVVLCHDGALQWWSLSDAEPAAQTPPGFEQAAPCRDLQLADADHDGDLDLLVLRATTTGSSDSVLLNNNLNGSYTALVEFSEALPTDAAARQWLAADFDADRDLDLLLLRDQQPPVLLRNDRLWAWQALAQPAGWGGAWQAATVADIEADGRAAIYAIDSQARVWRADPDRGQLSELGRSQIAAAGAQILSQDFDGDGRAELLLWSSDGIEVLSIEGNALRSLWHQPGKFLALQPVLRSPADGPELVALADGDKGLKLQRWAAGSGRHPFIAISPSGRSDGSDGMRSNAAGLGTQIRLRRGSHWSVVDQLDRHSARGQSLQPLAIGLGGAALADFVEFGWSDGVMQTELTLPVGELHVVQEQQRQLASCPVLFAWNGEQYDFVTDLLGVGGIGFLLSPGHYAESRPWEFFQLPEGSLQARDGRYLLKIGEPMEEVTYLDQARLHIYDLPPGWQMALDERMHTGGGPAPTGAPLFFRDTGQLGSLRIIDQHGRDVSETLSSADQQPLDPGTRDPRFLGRLVESMQLQLQLSEPLRSTEQLWLLGDGWVEYPYSQTLFAAWQAGASFDSFSLDVQRAGTDWQTAYPQFGYPAGMPRGFAIALNELQADSDTPIERLRLRGNLEVYLDRLRLVRAESAPPELSHQIATVSAASVRRVGFPRRSSLDFKRPHYDYQDRSPFWDTRYPEGHYTAFGPATELVQALDDGFAIIGPGDEIQLEFSAPPAPPDGWRRVQVLEVRGYAKDMDLYTRDGEQVEPLPVTPGVAAGEQGRQMARRFNTRFQQGR